MTALAINSSGSGKIEQFNQDKLHLLKNTVCKGASNDELELFLHICNRTGLDPFMKQIYSIPRGNQRTIQTSIDGLRVIANRTGQYSPGAESTFVYGEKKELISATSYVRKMTQDGTWHNVSCSAMYSEYKPSNDTFWKKMPHVMLAKCAEAAALRKAFPAEMSGIYIKEEMDQADAEILPSEKTQENKIDPELMKQALKDRKKEIIEIIGENELPFLVEYVANLKKVFPKFKDEDFFLKKPTNQFIHEFRIWRECESEKSQDKK